LLEARTGTEGSASGGKIGNEIGRALVFGFKNGRDYGILSWERIGKTVSPEENVSRIEPCHLSTYDDEVSSLVAELSSKASTLASRLHPTTAESLADLVRVMNCYYSNLIEGHNTRPKDIEKALADEIDVSPERRNLQLEAKAHIKTQRQMEQWFKDGALKEPAAVEFIQRLHREFYAEAPEAFLTLQSKQRSIRITPGRFRGSPDEDIVVGRHQPPSSARVAGFMDYFSKRYRFEGLPTATRIASMATAHHRFNYIHPFLDGNGRVSRLMSHAMGLVAGVGAHGLWSISRGLARGLQSRTEYKAMLDAADAPREGDLDGRGNLSERRLRDFVAWFLRVSVDQVQFMSSSFDLDRLKERLGAWVRNSPGIASEAEHILDRILQFGEVPRGEAIRSAGLPERTGRVVLSRLVERGILCSTTPKGPVRLRFDSESAELLFPRLFPEA
jgi:Fic family protein